MGPRGGDLSFDPSSPSSPYDLLRQSSYSPLGASAHLPFDAPTKPLLGEGGSLPRRPRLTTYDNLSTSTLPQQLSRGLSSYQDFHPSPTSHLMGLGGSSSPSYGASSTLVAQPGDRARITLEEASRDRESAV